MEKYDYIVVGLGCVGLSTVRELSRRGYKVLGLDMGSVPNPDATSYGYSRLLQFTSYTDNRYISILEDAQKLWKEIEGKVDQKLFFQNGTLEIHERGGDELDKSITFLNEANKDYQLLNNDEVNSNYNLFDLDHKYTAIRLQDGGTLDALSCMNAILYLSKKYGGSIHSHEEVIGVDTDDSYSYVKSNSDTYKSDKVILTAGAWMKEMYPILEDIINVRNHTYTHFLNVKNQLREEYPVFLIRRVNEPSFYGLMENSKDAVKFGVGSNSDDSLSGRKATSFTRGLDADESKVEVEGARDLFSVDISKRRRDTCLLSCTPDGNPLIDHHPSNERILFGTGMSGHGFKFSIISGKIISDLAVKNKSEYPTQQFSFDRDEIQTVLQD